MKAMPGECNDDSDERPEWSDPIASHLRWAIDIGVPFVPGSIRAHVEGEPVEVVEESAEGRVLLICAGPRSTRGRVDWDLLLVVGWLR